MSHDSSGSSFWKRHRTLILLAGIVLFLPPLAAVFQLTNDRDFCGSWCPRMFFAWRSGTPLGTYFASWLRSFAGVGLVVVVLLVTYKLGRQWCSHVCPVGGAIELGSRLVPKKLRLSFSFVPAAPVRHGYLLAYMALPAIGIGSLCCSYCNFATVPRLFGAAFSAADLAYFLRIQGIISLGLVLVLGVFAKGGRAYCNLLCPIGAFDALTNRAGARTGRRVRIDPDACIDCGKCTKVCPTWAIASHSKPVIDQLSCMPCRLCEKVCPTGAISYGKAKP